MRILIVSDTHRQNENFYRVVDLVKPELVVHCGDVEGSEEELIRAAGCPVYMVAGNNDFFSDLPKELEVSIAGHRTWITHGHHYYVSMGPEMIREEAIQRGAEIVMYGHTHRPVVYRDANVIAVNPGSLSYPRQEGRKPSYIIMESDRKGELHFTIAYLD